jgi:hypothetical protein
MMGASSAGGFIRRDDEPPVFVPWYLLRAIIADTEVTVF